MYRIIVWGSGREFDRLRPSLELEERRGNVEIIGITSKEDYLHHIGGYKFYNKPEVSSLPFDYIVAATEKYYKDICREALELSIPIEKIIRGDVFYVPYFDFKRYVKIKENRISIVSNHCWGGVVCHRLGLPFLSPFVNMLIDNEDYVRLVCNLPFYLKQPLKDGGRNRTGAPLGRLSDVTIQFIHHQNFESAKRDWNRRVSRVNYDNIFAEFTAGADDVAVRKFSNCNYNKTAFTTREFDYPYCTFLKDWSNDIIKSRYTYMFGIYILDLLKTEHRTSCPIDILKLLSDETFIMKY